MATTSDDATDPRSAEAAPTPPTAQVPLTAQVPQPAPVPRSEQIDSADLSPLLAALTSLRDGDFSVRLPRGDGVLGLLADRVNETAEISERRTRDLVRLSRVIGR